MKIEINNKPLKDFSFLSILGFLIQIIFDIVTFCFLTIITFASLYVAFFRPDIFLSASLPYVRLGIIMVVYVVYLRVIYLTTSLKFKKIK